jgi:salicylate hydroxylase
MNMDVVIAGAGIAGLAAALAAARAGCAVTVYEPVARLAEVGAGLQLGPNAVRVLADWGLEGALVACAAFPQALVARDARSGAALGRLPLGERSLRRYGQPYATVHRADLHGLLLDAVRATPAVRLQLGQGVRGWAPGGGRVRVGLDGGGQDSADLLLGCDGLWGRVRSGWLGDAPPQATGHLAYRGLVPAADWPAELPADLVLAWMGPRMHAVTYPVRAGKAFNVVVIVEGELGSDVQNWSHAAERTELRQRTGALAPGLSAALDAVPQWLRWPLFERPPLAGPEGQGQGVVALLGDAAHPMRPYLAQGAAMALEDAWALGRLLARPGATASGVVAELAHQRWQRNAWVQWRSRRNGRIFHLAPPWSWARNLAMAVGGEHLMDVSRLYGGPSGWQG